MLRLPLVLAVLAMALVAAAPAPEPPAKVEPAPATPAEPASPSGIPVTDMPPNKVIAVLGQPVVGPLGAVVGRLVDVLVGKDGTPEAAVIDFGGFLGVGSRKIAVHWNTLHFNPGDDKYPVVLDLMPAQIKAAPSSYQGETKPAPVVVAPWEPPASAPGTPAAAPTAAPASGPPPTPPAVAAAAPPAARSGAPVAASPAAPASGPQAMPPAVAAGAPPVARSGAPATASPCRSRFRTTGHACPPRRPLPRPLSHRSGLARRCIASPDSAPAPSVTSPVTSPATPPATPPGVSPTAPSAKPAAPQ